MDKNVSGLAVFPLEPITVGLSEWRPRRELKCSVGRLETRKKDIICRKQRMAV